MIDYGRPGFDVETYSPTDISAGAWMYTRDPQAELLCFAPSIDGYCLDLWIPGQPLPEDWLKAVYGAGQWVFAFNWWFEYCVFNNIMVRQLDLPAYLPASKFDCVAARSRCYGMPQRLEGVTDAFNIPMGKITNYLQVTKPRKPSKHNTATRWYPDTAPEKFDKLYNQCLLDEWGEVMVDKILPPWNDHERVLFQLDQRINARGVPIDRELCQSAIKIIGQLERKYWVRLEYLTGGHVQTHSQSKKIVEWISARGVPCTSIAVEHVSTMLNDKTIPEDVREVLNIRKTMGLESIKKFYKFESQSDPDTGKLYDQFRFYGAQATGRWAAWGCQLHNLTRGSLKIPKGADYDEFVGQIINNIKRESLDYLELIYENPVAILSSVIRPTISAPEGLELCVSDYSNIEGRVIFWLAGIEDGLEVFRSGQDLYIDVAADIYGVTYAQLLSDYKGKIEGADTKRMMGKQAVLGLNYQMAAKTFIATIAKYGIVWCAIKQDWIKVGDGQVKDHRESQTSLYTGYWLSTERGSEWISAEDQQEAGEIAAGDMIVQAYRGKFPGLKKFWYDLEKAAIATVMTGCPHSVGDHLVFEMTQCGRWLRCNFPSGRSLYWFSPEIRSRRAAWCKDDENPDYRDQLTFLRWIKRQYVRESTYGGDLAESVTQGIARDILGNGMLSAENNGYNVIMHVHDEVVALQPLGTSNIDHFNTTISTLPPWAQGCPIEAEGWVGKHYRKD